MIRTLILLAYATMLGWDGSAFVSALLHGQQRLAWLSGAGAILLCAIIYFHMTKSSRADAVRGTEP